MSKIWRIPLKIKGPRSPNFDVFDDFATKRQICSEWNIISTIGERRWLHLHSLCGATLFSSHQRHLFPPVWQRLVGFGFRVQPVRSIMHNLRRVGENSYPILSRLWTKVHEIFRRCRKREAPCTFQRLFRLSVSRFIQKIFAIKSRSRRKTEQMPKFVGPQFL